MNRRDVIRTLSGALVVAPLFARARPAAGRFTIGMLGVGSPATPGGTYDAGGAYNAFYARMRDLGYVEGRNISYEVRWGHGQLDTLPRLAAELVALRVDVIVASFDPAIVAAKHATSTIPIIMTLASSPAEQGLIASLARPGGNITGFSLLAGTEMRGERIALLKAIVPGLSRVVVLGYVGDRDTFVAEQLTYAQRLGLSVDVAEIRNVNDIDNALSAIAGKRPDALVDAGQVTFLRPQQIAEFALAQRLPCIGPARLFAQAGHLLSLGVDTGDRYRRAATYVDKILKGAKPGDLPVEQPTKFELVINLKTAKALGIRIPQVVLLRADEVIE
jgi:putative tryptophan/tyrosine transport system substrate-binding protein